MLRTIRSVQEKLGAILKREERHTAEEVREAAEEYYLLAQKAYAKALNGKEKLVEEGDPTGVEEAFKLSGRLIFELDAKHPAVVTDGVLVALGEKPKYTTPYLEGALKGIRASVYFLHDLAPQAQELLSAKLVDLAECSPFATEIISPTVAQLYGRTMADAQIAKATSVSMGREVVNLKKFHRDTKFLANLDETLNSNLHAAREVAALVLAGYCKECIERVGEVPKPVLKRAAEVMIDYSFSPQTRAEFLPVLAKQGERLGLTKDGLEIYREGLPPRQAKEAEHIIKRLARTPAGGGKGRSRNVSFDR